MIEEYYTNESGEKELLFSIKGLYDVKTKNINVNGLGISYFLSTFMTESSEYVEYLVTPEHLISTMKITSLYLPTKEFTHPTVIKIPLKLCTVHDSMH